MVVHINQLYHVQPLNQNPQDLTLLPIFYFLFAVLYLSMAIFTYNFYFTILS